jgi:hypothetical protein
MLEYASIMLLILVSVFLWSFIGKHPEFPARILSRLKRAEAMDYELFDLSHVFSAETADGKEAEFIDDKLYDKRKIVRFSRAILVILCILLIVYMFVKC